MGLVPWSNGAKRSQRQLLPQTSRHTDTWLPFRFDGGRASRLDTSWLNPAQYNLEHLTRSTETLQNSVADYE